MSGMSMITDAQGNTQFTFYGACIPKEDHGWIDLTGFRERGTFVCRNLSQHLQYGDFVVTSLQAGPTNDLKHVGYCVQIREGRGAFRSDQVFIRHPDGNLECHENQSFWVLCKADRDAVVEHFKTAPDSEGGDIEYRIQGEQPEVGFIIEKAPDMKPARTKGEM